MGKTSTHGDRWLLGNMVCYGIVNFVALAVPFGMNSPSIFGILPLFISIGPLLGISVVFAVQFGCDRPFTWLAIVFFMLAMAVASCVNILIFIEASSAV